MVLKVETVVLSLPKLIVVIIEGFLSEAHLCRSALKGVNSFAFLVDHLVKLPPVVDILHGLADGSFLDFLFGFTRSGTGVLLGFAIGGDAPISDFDCTVEKEFIFEVNYLFEGKLPDVHIEFPREIKVKEVAVVEVEA